ncbi:hypothetical protein ABZO31_14885 [Streptomyces sp. HUAS MG47]|uniref:hypothetical protein n=1 Tax=Streptomyces solicamelliae TaxID=3231716 RepID=UPI003877AA28
MNVIADAGELIDDWESIYQGYFLGEHDETLLDCAERLDSARAAPPADDPDVTAFYTLGLVWTYAHAATEADPDVARRVVAALSTAGGAAPAACDHDAHPCDDDLDTHLESFEVVLSLLAGRDAGYTWQDLDGGAGWRCPRNVAGFARAAAAAIGR